VSALKEGHFLKQMQTHHFDVGKKGNILWPRFLKLKIVTDGIYRGCAAELKLGGCGT
jgi:hypothetical protein